MLARMRWGLIGSICGGLAVMAGAFGAHALRGTLDARMLEIFETAARYEMFHAFALIVVAWRSGSSPGRAATLAGVLFTAGIVIFSGSLYALALSGVRGFGAVTPLGGLCLIVAWGALAVTFVKPARRG